jgi:predicted nucleic acid-binding protein
VDHPAALTLAARHGVTAYDARYLAVAQVLHTRLVTENGKPRRAAPDLTCSLAKR